MKHVILNNPMTLLLLTKPAYTIISLKEKRKTSCDMPVGRIAREKSVRRVPTVDCFVEENLMLMGKNSDRSPFFFSAECILKDTGLPEDVNSTGWTVR